MENETSQSEGVLDERAVILKCQHGDRQAFAVLVERYKKRAYFIALGMVGSHDSALDLSQEAFVRAYRSLAKFDVNKKFFTYFYKILQNLCFNYLRDKSRHAKSFSEMSEQYLLELSDENQDSSRLTELNELKHAIWQSMSMLNKREREIIILKDFQDLSYKQIAEILECPIGTVMSRLYNARKALKNKLERFLD